MKNNDYIKIQQDPKTIRVLGTILIFLGIFLAGGMGMLMMGIQKAMNNPSSTHRFNESTIQTDMIFPVLGMVAAFGVTAMVAGIWQVMTGERNKTLIWLMIGLWLILMVLANVIPAIF